MGLFLDIHTDKYKDNREVVWDMAVAMNTELLALRDAGCRCIQIEEPTLHFMANTFGAKHEKVKFMVECYNREVQGLDDVEIWIHTCWGNPNMQRVMEDTSYKASFESVSERAQRRRLDDRDQGSQFRDIELFGRYKGKLPKKICIGAVSHRTLQADRAAEVADSIRTALEAHRARAADRVERLRVRASGLQPRDRVSTRRAPSPRAATSSARSSGSRRPTFRPPTRRCRWTSCRRRRRGDGVRSRFSTGRQRGVENRDLTPLSPQRRSDDPLRLVDDLLEVRRLLKLSA